ncbi:MAG: hypothetical protein HQL50_12970 [Magnetococcales bacterium]|nr:hypothetical protein [Magnetococcales bacterium]
MEFFRTVTPHPWHEELIQSHLTIDTLGTFCPFIEQVTPDNRNSRDRGTIFCDWGTFQTLRQTIRGGVRFLLPTCPNALTWSITAGFPPAPQGVTVHCTINRTSHDAEFIETIDAFMDAWQEGLSSRVS